jgi:hypothetical protein
LILLPRREKLFASLRKHFASYRRIKRVTPVVHQNAARSLLVFAHFLPSSAGTILALAIGDNSGIQSRLEVRPMRDEDFFGVLRLVMPKAKERERA